MCTGLHPTSVMLYQIEHAKLEDHTRRLLCWIWGGGHGDKPSAGYNKDRPESVALFGYLAECIIDPTHR